MAPPSRQALSVLWPVQAGKEATLLGALGTRGADLVRALSRVESLHFARLAWVPSRAESPVPTGGELLFESTFDGEPGAHLRELYERAGDALWPFLESCEGFDAKREPSVLERGVERGERRAAAFFCAHPGMSARRIRDDARLRDALRSLLSRERARLVERTPLEILTELRATLAPLPSPEPSISETAPERGAWPGGLAALLRLLPTLLLMLGHDLLDRARLLWHGGASRRAAAEARAPLGLSRSSAAQRAFTHLTELKPGAFRRRALRRVLRRLDGALSSSPAGALPSVHAARLVLLNDGRLLFSSQHDGSVSERLAGLGRLARAGLGLLWSSTCGFPASWPRLLGGWVGAEALTDWARRHELGATLSYSAYPSLTVRDIRVNAELRALLVAPPSEARARRLLRLV